MPPIPAAELDQWPRDLPGISAFALADGEIFHTYSSYARGGDALWSMCQWLDRAPLGRNETPGWFRLHDEYDGPAHGTDRLRDPDSRSGAKMEAEIRPALGRQGLVINFRGR